MTYIEGQTKLGNRVMRRIYFIWFTRKALHPLTIKTATLAFFVWQILINISLINIYSNAVQTASGEGGSFYSFFSHAVTHTDLVVQIFGLGLVALFAWIIFDIKQSFRRVDQGGVYAS